MSLEQEAQILEAVASTSCGIRDLTRTLKWKTSTVISLSKKMNQERLIEFKMVKYSRRGRPKKNIVCTSLGLDFLEAYRKLKMKPIRARREDLEHAAKDALYTQRLVENGHSPFKTFMELNTIVGNIKVASETNQTV
jgi:DNA-binding MarR family transcriptional regulator